MEREVHKIYDLILKVIILTYLTEFLKYIGENREIVEVLRTEISTLNGKTKFLDFLCRLADNTLCHIEFEFPVAYTDDLKRFFDYNITAQIRHDKLTETIIFNFTDKNRGAKRVDIGKTKKFSPQTFYLGNIDFENELEKINIKLGLNLLEKIINPEKPYIQLTNKEELHLLLMSLPPKYKNKKKFLKSVVELLKNEEIFHKEKINVIKAIIQLEIKNLLSKDEQNEFKGEIKMTDEAEKIFKQATYEVNRKYEQEAIYEAEKEGRKEGKEEGRKEGMKEGMEEGKKKTQEEIAKKLKEIMNPEQISKITGLPFSEVLKL